ncbi:MAG: SIMPL domain-containing protein [Anaerolineae bacterium]|nr:SIMPL domain-containing protein [Anaerolineae bacterium]
MSRIRKFFGAVVVMLVLTALAVPALAQDSGVASAPYPENTISVTGYGSVHASPDIASVDVGVEVTQPSVSDAFTEANSTLQKIIDALADLGIAPEDIQTSNLNVYSTINYSPETGSDQHGYTVSNVVHLVVRDVDQVEAVIDAAINAGATSIYGLTFDIEDRSALETQAREMAIQDAQARAQEYASLVGAQLGDVVIVSELQSGSFLPYAASGVRAQGGGGGAVVAPGQTEVQIQATVTYRISR